MTTHASMRYCGISLTEVHRCNHYSFFVIFLKCLKYRIIQYCHWNSNKHVFEGLSGLTDLDILVDPGQSLKVLEILDSSGFKKCNSPQNAACASKLPQISKKLFLCNTYDNISPSFWDKMIKKYLVDSSQQIHQFLIYTKSPQKTCSNIFII